MRVLAALASAVAALAPSVAAAADPSGFLAQPGVEGRVNTTGRDLPLGGSLSDGGFVLGEIDFVLTADDRIVVSGPALLALLRRAVTPGAFAEIEAAVAGRDLVPQQDLEPAGVHLSLNPATFGLDIRLPADVRARQSVSLTGGYDTDHEVVAAPAGLSGYVTAFVNGDYIHRGLDTGFATPSALVEGAVRYRGVVLESEATVQDRFQREGTRFVYDDLRRTARYTLGDLRPVSRGFSGSSTMSGLSMVRTYSELEPQRNIQPSGQRSFTLVRPSTVETYVNGRLIQQGRFEPGNYDVRDFPFAQGGNDVRLVIRDDTGAESVIAFSINFDRTLLAPGLTEFGAFLGVHSPFGPDGREYSSDAVGSGFFRRGLSSSLTAGANFHASAQGGVVGGEAVWASPVGTLGADLAVSMVRDADAGYAANFSYERLLITEAGDTRSLNATYQTTSADFAVPGPIRAIANNPFAHEFGLTYSQTFGPRHYIAADAFHAIGRGEVEDQSSLRLSHGWRPNARLLLTSELAYEDRRGLSDVGVRVALTYRFSRFTRGTAEVDTQRDRARVAFQTSRGRGVGSWNATGSVDRFSDGTGLNATYSAILNRAEVGATHLTSFNDLTGEISDQRTSLRTGASVAFADGAWAVSRPIYNSFAMLRPHRSLAGAPVYIESRSDEYLARSGAFGPAVASELSAYSPRLLTYDVPSAPPGYNLGSGTVQLWPPYRSGYLIEVGSDYYLTATGRLLLPGAEPLSLLAGLAFEVAEPSRPGLRLFTNAGGRFALQGLRPGVWRLEFPGQGGRTLVYLITVAEGGQGLVRLGDVTPEEM